MRCRFRAHLAALALAAACADARPGLPEIPPGDGPLRLRVVYPAAAPVPAAGHDLVLGSLGSGRATLLVDGAPVRVHPNGAFAAYVPVPAPGAPGYRMVAVLDGDTVRLTHPVRRGPAALPLRPGGPPAVDTASLEPRAGLALADGEPVRVAVRAPADATVLALAGGRTVPLRDVAASSTVGRRTLRRRPDAGSGQWAAVLPAEALRGGGTLRVARGADTLRLPLPAVAPAAPACARIVGAGESVSATPTVGGTHGWALLPGTAVEVTGRRGDQARVRLGAGIDAWVAAGSLQPLEAGAAPAERVTGDARLVAEPGWVDLVIPVSAPAAVQVEEGPRSLAVTLLGTRSATARIRYPAGNDALVQTADWVQTGDGVRFVVHLSAPPFGYRVLGAPGALVVRVRRPPAVSRRRPLRGLTIAVDPGHPPAGAVGPAGLPESEATLAVARRLVRLLEDRGARVVLTRPDAGAVGLDERPARAVAANAHALVSLHADALPPGVDLPRGRGTSTHFFHPHSAPLARAVQRGMLARMGVEDRGLSRSSLALVRTPWMPAVLCEGATLVDPVHEAALRTPAFQEAYARGVVDGLEAFFRGLADSAARP